MYPRVLHLAITATLVAILQTAASPATASKDLGNGFRDHGVAVPISNHRGIVATTDSAGHPVVLAWLMDHRGGYELLLVDAQTGKAEEFPLPFSNSKGDSPFASILSSGNRFYTHFGDNFVEFDPAKRAFTFSSKTQPQMAMGMTEDDKGVIWSVTYPNSGVVAFDPKTRQLRDYGHVYPQNWQQYQRHVAADDAGWIYFALGETASQIVAFDPVTSKATPMLAESERKKGSAHLYRNLDGKVYGQAHRSDTEWYELYKGAGKKIGKHEPLRPKRNITGSQALTHATFPDGARLENLDLVNRQLLIQDRGTSDVRKLPFDYTSEGAVIMGMAAAPDGTICGGTAFPMRFFSLDTAADQLINRQAYGQWNTVARRGDHFFVGGYPYGFLLEWDPAKPWINTEKGIATNPTFLTQVSPVIHRPHRLLPLPDGKTVVMGGTPQYGYTGGGLLFWDRQTSSQVLLKDTDLIPDQSTMSLIDLPNGKLLGGTTTQPGTGGEKKAKQAEMYLLDAPSKKVEWHAPVFSGAQSYTDMCHGPGGLIYGFADRKLFYVFDPTTRSVVHQQDVQKDFGLTPSEQGPRIFITGPQNSIYVLFVSGIASLNTATHKLTLLEKSPVPINAGGDYINGRIYFATGSHLCSYQLDPAGKQ